MATNVGTKKNKGARNSNASANASTEEILESGLDRVISSMSNADADNTAASNTSKLLQALMALLTKLNGTLEGLTERLDRSDTQMHDLLVENDNLKAENTKLKKDLADKAVRLELETEQRERQKRCNNIKISGLDIGNKQSAVITDDIIKMHNDVLNDRDPLSKVDITNVYVVRGRQYGNTKKPDCVIVTLADKNRKKDFYALSASMRKNKELVYIGDDMTAGQRQLMYELKKRKDLFSKVMYRDGTMRCLKLDGGWRNFGYLHELEKLPAQQNTAASPRAAMNA